MFKIMFDDWRYLAASISGVQKTENPHMAFIFFDKKKAETAARMLGGHVVRISRR